MLLVAINGVFSQLSSSNATLLSHKRVLPNALENKHFPLVLTLLHHTHTHTHTQKFPILFSLHPSKACFLEIIIN